MGAINLTVILSDVLSQQVLIIALRAVLAGGFVVLLAVLSNAFLPKFFAGLFSGAPTVAAASLLVIGLREPEAARMNALAMIPSAIGLATCCAVAAWAVPRLGALRASTAAWASWALVSLGLYRLFLA